MNITRRHFLKLIIGSITTISLPNIVFSKIREPYVIKGESVNYIGPSGGGFIGGEIVDNIKDWDGVGFIVDVRTNTYPSKIETYYDFELCNFTREIPENFWHNQTNCKKYNNVHTYIRTQRFGETINEAIKHLNFYTK